MRAHALIGLGIWVALIAPIPVLSANLSPVRLGDFGEAGSQARQRVQRLRDLLGTQGFSFSVLSEPGNVFTQGAEFQRKHELKTADYVKRKLLSAADQLQLEEQYGAPAVFDPSLFGFEQAQQAQERRRAFFEQILGADFDMLVSELEAQVSGGAKATRDVTPLPENAGAGGVARTQLIAAYVAQHQPEVSVSEAPVTVESVLGNLYRVDVFDDVTTKLRFSKLELPLGSLQAVADADEVAVSLSMLIAVRTEFDNYFVFVLGYLLDKLEAQKTTLTAQQAALEKRGLWFGEKSEHAANAEKLKKLEWVLTHIREQHSGAVAANQLLGQLTPAQLDFLIDLMLQLRGEDVPVDSDIGKLIERAQAAPEDFLHTYQFYNQLDDELYRLETYVEAESRMAAQVQKIIEEMKK